jgi:hypothetical protein
MHDLSELNNYTGLFSAGCLMSLVFCFFGLTKIAEGLHNFHQDYRQTHSMDEHERDGFIDTIHKT